MKSRDPGLIRIAVILLIITTTTLAFSVTDEDRVKGVVDDFYAAYLHHADKSTDKFLDQSTSLTQAFKRAYHKLVADAKKKDPELGLDYDPVLDAQDFPSRPFKAFDVKVEGNRASVKVKSKDWPDRTLRATLVKERNGWLINSINEVNEKPARN